MKNSESCLLNNRFDNILIRDEVLTSFCLEISNEMQSTESASQLGVLTSNDRLCNGFESCLKIVFDKSIRTGLLSVGVKLLPSFILSISTIIVM